MITIRKLSTLPPVNALRKAARLLQGFERDLVFNKSLNTVYLKDLISFILLSHELNPKEREEITTITQNTEDGLLRICNDLRHLLLKHLKEEPADWDLLTPYNSEEEKLHIQNRKILPFEI